MLNIYLKICSHICRACIIIRCFLVEYPPLGINIISECSVVCEMKTCIVQSHNIRESQYQLAVFAYSLADTPQFRWGNPYFFSENLYQSVSFICASMYSENVHAIHIAMQFTKKSRHCVIQIDSRQQITKIGALLHVARHSD